MGRVVGFGGSGYVALVENVVHERDLGPSFWTVIAEAGAPGAAGPQVPAGAPGPWVGPVVGGSWLRRLTTPMFWPMPRRLVEVADNPIEINRSRGSMDCWPAIVVTM